MRRRTKGLFGHWLLLGLLAALLVLLLSLDALVDRPLHGYAVREANERLEGYTITIDELDAKPWRLGVEVAGFRLTQDRHPRPPVVELAEGTFGLDWRALLRGRLVADARLLAPRLHLNLDQIRAERDDEVPLEERGWRRLVEIYRLRLNRLEIRNGRLTYVDPEAERPIEISELDGHLHNIRHVREGEAPYPSPFELAATLFGEGRLTATGEADLLREPHPAVRGRFRVEGLPLAALGPVVERISLDVEGGRLDARGEAEVTPERLHLRLAETRIAGVDAALRSPAPEPAAELAERAAEAADQARSTMDTKIAVDRLQVTGRFGWVNTAADPVYRLYFEEAELSLRDFAAPATGEARFSARGLFMGSGRTLARGVFRPRGDAGPDFAVELEIRDTDLTALNDLIRAHGKLDVAEGELSVFSQVRVAEGRIRGYVKPLLGDVEVHDPEQDDEQNVFATLYEKVADAVASILENQPRDEIATVTDLSGPLEDPEASAWQIVANLLRNAFIDAILPGFTDREEAGSG